MVIRVGGQCVMYGTANSTPQRGKRVVAAVMSQDLVHCGDKGAVFTASQRGTFGGPTESPFVAHLLARLINWPH